VYKTDCIANVQQDATQTELDIHPLLDTICVITGKDGRHAVEAQRDLINRDPEVDGNITHFKRLRFQIEAGAKRGS